MTVYVDDMYRSAMGAYRGMKMSHMFGDDVDELHNMAKKIGLQVQWFQGDHYDIAMVKRRLAIDNGAVQVPMRVGSFMRIEAREGRPMPTPNEAVKMMKEKFDAAQEVRYQARLARDRRYE